MKAILLFIALFSTLAEQDFVLADDLDIQSVVENFLLQIDAIKKQIENIIELDNDILKDLPTILNDKVSTELEAHPVVLQTKYYLKSSKEGKYLTEECETLFNTKYEALKKEIYQKLYEKIAGYYGEMKQVLTTRFPAELQEFERRVHELPESPDKVEFFRSKMNGAFKLISDIEIAQHDIIVKTLNYFKEEDSAEFIDNNLFVPFTECLQNTIDKQ